MAGGQKILTMLAIGSSIETGSLEARPGFENCFGGVRKDEEAPLLSRGCR